MKTAEIILVPGPGISHSGSALEFAKWLLDHDDQISITILATKLPFFPSVDSFAGSLAPSQHRIKFIDLHPSDPPPPELFWRSPEAYIYDFIESHKSHVKTIVSSLSNSDSVRVAAVVVDFFCVSMIDVATELGVPSYIFLTFNAGFLGLLLYLPKRHEENSAVIRESDPELLLPGFVNPVPARVLPDGVFDEYRNYDTYVKIGQKFKEAKGIMVNTYAELESYAIKSFDGHIPPVYPVGPLLKLNGQPHPDLDQDQQDKITKWLDEQPQKSVAFLCFGSHGSFSARQVQEIAIGLEQSGHKFLWSMRVPLSGEFMDPEEMLPEGFLERVAGRGMVCGWAPQCEILAHKAIGGFVSHCGWNSVLESLWFGVPIATLPMYAEQQLNAFKLVKELGLAVELKLDYRMYGSGDLIMADEIARGVKCVLRSDSEVKKKVKEMSEMARKAVLDGGSSYTYISQLIMDMIGSC